ncbi:hypothetical protein [Streptomyces ziwulingensis]|uniref:Uncharacterized protein n=1 Tax=Streptomyces ziwulingensis TaxID=1045501 RepID=A0ABP9BZB0_9ACTN
MAPDVPAPGPPNTPEQALDIVRSRYAQPTLPDGSPAELRVEEFDVGYLVYTYVPPAAGAGGPSRPASPAAPATPAAPAAPAAPGGSKIVVDKETGETVTVPNYPTETAIALYRRQRR